MSDAVSRLVYAVLRHIGVGSVGSFVAAANYRLFYLRSMCNMCMCRLPPALDRDVANDYSRSLFMLWPFPREMSVGLSRMGV